jgi:molybdopterin molybdotransferase
MVALAAGLAGRVLSDDVLMRGDHPPFTNSAMDGYAVRATETPGDLTVVGESRAGQGWGGTLAPGQAIVISTGAPLPAGADAIIARERAVLQGNVVQVPLAAPGAFVREQGSDARSGDRLLTAGTRLAAHHVAALAGAGHAEVMCRPVPRVAILTTGDEVVAPGAPLGPGQVWNVNGPGLVALVDAAGAGLTSLAAARDDRRATVDALTAALADGPDLLVTTGGVSMSDHDHLRPAFEELGAQEIFWGVEIRPGHPLWFGRIGETHVLGLPGNPVAAVVCFLVFGRAVLGCDDPWNPHVLAVDYQSPTPRTDLIRAYATPDGLIPVVGQMSYHVSGLARATHIVEVAPGAKLSAWEIVAALRIAPHEAA